MAATITLPCHKHPPHHRLPESTSPCFAFSCISGPFFLFVLLFGHFFLCLYPSLFPYHQLIPLLCQLFSNPLFLSFISSVENGISPNIHFALLPFHFCFLYSYLYPPFLSPLVLSTYSLFLVIPHSSLIPSHPFVSRLTSFVKLCPVFLGKF